MKHRFVYANSFCVNYKSYGCSWSGNSLLRTYECLVQSLIAAGLGPTHLAAVAPGLGKNYGKFSAKHPRLLKSISQA